MHSPCLDFTSFIACRPGYLLKIISFIFIVWCWAHCRVSTLWKWNFQSIFRVWIYGKQLVWRESPLFSPYKRRGASQQLFIPLPSFQLDTPQAPTFSFQGSFFFSPNKKTKMGLSQRNCALLLVCVAVVWIELSQGEFKNGLLQDCCLCISKWFIFVYYIVSFLGISS